MDNAFFETIINNYSQKKIVSLCKKLIKKCSFGSMQDVWNLNDLAYWLFIYGYKKEALSLAQFTHDIPFPGKSAFNVWDFILTLWGLEVHILKEIGNTKEADIRIKAMDTIWMTPIGIFDTKEKQKKKEYSRRSRFLYPDILENNKIGSSTSIRDANQWRFIALKRMIGYSSTDLFPNLKEHYQQLSCDIAEYISILSNIK